MRFHCGISFSWRTIKKFLFPFLLGLLAFFGFNTIYDYVKDNGVPLGVLKAYALENYDTQFNNSIPDYIQRLSNQSCQNIKPYDYINQIIEDVDFSTSTYQMYITTPSTNFVDIYFYLSTTDFDEITYYANSSKSMFLKSQPVITFNARFTLKFGYTGSCPSGSPFEQNFYIHLIDFIQNGNTQWLGSSSYFGNLMAISSTFSFQDSGYSTTANNNSNYNTDWWFYYSSRKLYLSDDDFSGDSFFHKNVYITNNDLLIHPGDFAPSYYNIYVSPPEPDPSEPSFIGYKTQLETFYTDIPNNSFNSYFLKVKFKVPQSLLGSSVVPQDYIDNLNFDYVCSGRLNNSSYYSYDSFDCSLTKSYVITTNNIEFTFSNVTTNQNLSVYDKLYVTINPRYLSNSVSKTLFDLSYTYSLGNFMMTPYKGNIYEKFINLPLDFKTYISSNNPTSSSSLYVKKSSFVDYGINIAGYSNTSNQQNLVVGSSLLGYNSSDEETYNGGFIKLSVTSQLDKGILIYQKDSALLSTLELFFDKGIIISFNNTSSDSFYFIDSNGDISQGNFVKPIMNNSNTSYDISYYIGIVNDFIDGLSSDSLELAILTQSFYDSLPVLFQTFLFVVFIIVDIYMAYILMKRW